jgi:hypothetical protein
MDAVKGRLDILVEKWPRGVVEQGYKMLYGKSQLNNPHSVN